MSVNEPGATAPGGPRKARIDRVLFSQEAIAGKVRELAERIRQDYAAVPGANGTGGHGAPLTVVGILKGAFVFTADLVRALGALDVPLQVDFMAVSSYGTATQTSGIIRILKDLDRPIRGQHVLLIEDIVDTGLTLRYLREHLMAQDPASLRACVLLDKPERRLVDVPVEYVGFQIPDEFVVGYGIDYAEQFRYLPYIACVRLEPQ
ncbi:hypoxanthine phosphoribosyltransferase [Thermaerobacter marianensis DSM 12885]|uniref:Hypoxanthine phosphoribosyltransferase n=1 Tax=Thermaerobacter marianensis (strain ATCC 700841 / DSM 12885 / JCM 10246 / 7p75a) TaxID=644966 RepID=E6SMJ7_THEM7|nr:hypoxanthine phosphoribosyltransferase [Thermaerobacter marianensis]ADU50457.1 hypoxanthine phosphoribosyltransferase [Thermaerobacter marianensis DSM 12885]